MTDDFYSPAAIGERIRTQDNRCTANPIFLVEQRRRDYGYDTQWADGSKIAWIRDGEGCEADEREHAKLEDEYRVAYEEPNGWTRTAYVDRWEYVTACFTAEAAQDYIEKNAHNLTEPRVYAASGYRNYEWQAIRKMLMEMTDD